MKRYDLVGLVLLAWAFGLSGCGEKVEPKAETVAGHVVPATAVVPAFPLKPYDATLDEGIDFKKQGWPSFLAEASGLSGYEPWGRWTDALSGSGAKFRFKQALPKRFILEITGHPYGPNLDQSVKVRVGKVEKSFVMDKKDANTYRLAFETDGAADMLEITPSKPTSPQEIDPKNGDTRKLGIALTALKIKQ